MTNIKVTRDQLSTCKLRQRSGCSCRDCIYNDSCDPDFRRIMTCEIKIDTDKNMNEREVKKNGYQ